MDVDEALEYFLAAQHPTLQLKFVTDTIGRNRDKIPAWYNEIDTDQNGRISLDEFDSNN